MSKCECVMINLHQHYDTSVVGQLLHDAVVSCQLLG